ncbi:RNA-directed DNA polymerase [Microbacterium sp. NPDC077663]|uniref:RNA-directed DNA polymerase n=1 Tax=Microbacterium sp. NPDC077663 TaxID=3364189 RepID=UPI0037CC6002
MDLGKGGQDASSNRRGVEASKGSASVSNRNLKGIEELSETRYLRSIWSSEISKQLNDLKFSSHNFVVDPLQGAVIARNIDDFIGQLSRDLKSGAYAPGRGVIIRSAKKLGISRPVCVLHPRDALVYRAIVKLAEGELLRGVPSWVAFQRADKGSSAEDDTESLDWFERWMRHEGMLPNLLERDDINFVVQSDISNFFPSIRLEVVREHLSNNTSLDRTLVRLCCQIISAVHPRTAYADDSFLGLPQEAQNTSRVIAQAVLKPIDTEFADLGKDGRYSRFMDDVLWGVETSEEAHRILARFQLRLEALGLYPNGSKTRILSKSEFIESYMISSNAELSRVDDLVEPLFDHGRLVKDVPAELAEEVVQLASKHRTLPVRPDRWSRVTRRFYTIHRRLGLPDMAADWATDLADDPGGAATYFEYFRSWPLTKDGLNTAGAAVDGYFGLYADVEVMFAEAVATAPVAKDEELWSWIFDYAADRFKRSATGPGKDSNLASLWYLTAFKYGNFQQRATVSDKAVKWCAASMPEVVVQVAAVDAKIDLSAVLPAAQYGPEQVVAADFLRRLDRKDAQSLNVVLNQLTPRPLLAPLRFVVRPRSLQLLDRAGGLRGLRDGRSKKWLADLESNEPRLRDHRVEYLLSVWT